MVPERLIFLGDAGRCSRYLGFARAKAHVLVKSRERRGVSVLQSRFVVDKADIFIKASSNSVVIQIEVEGGWQFWFGFTVPGSPDLLYVWSLTLPDELSADSEITVTRAVNGSDFHDVDSLPVPETTSGLYWFTTVVPHRDTQVSLFRYYNHQNPNTEQSDYQLHNQSLVREGEGICINNNTDTGCTADLLYPGDLGAVIYQNDPARVYHIDAQNATTLHYALLDWDSGEPYASFLAYISNDNFTNLDRDVGIAYAYQLAEFATENTTSVLSHPDGNLYYATFYGYNDDGDFVVKLYSTPMSQIRSAINGTIQPTEIERNVLDFFLGSQSSFVFSVQAFLFSNFNSGFVLHDVSFDESYVYLYDADAEQYNPIATILASTVLNPMNATDSQVVGFYGSSAEELFVTFKTFNNQFDQDQGVVIVKLTLENGSWTQTVIYRNEVDLRVNVRPLGHYVWLWAYDEPSTMQLSIYDLKAEYLFDFSGSVNENDTNLFGQFSGYKDNFSAGIYYA